MKGPTPSIAAGRGTLGAGVPVSPPQRDRELPSGMAFPWAPAWSGSGPQRYGPGGPAAAPPRCLLALPSPLPRTLLGPFIEFFAHTAPARAVGSRRRFGERSRSRRPVGPRPPRY